MLAEKYKSIMGEHDVRLDSLYLDIPFSGMTEDRLVAEVRSIWRKVSSDNRAARRSQALYPVYRKPVLYTLQKRLMLFRLAKMKFGNLIEIGWEAGVLTATDAARSDEANRQKVSRQLKYAKCIVNYTKYGLFPYHEPYQDESIIPKLIDSRERLSAARRKEFHKWKASGNEASKIQRELEIYADIITRADEDKRDE
jgi:hypothetical protein